VRTAGADRLDLAGMVLAAGGFGLLVFGLVEAPNDGWGSATVVLSMASAAAFITTFLVVEHHAVAPLISRALSREPMFVWPTVAIAGASFLILGVLFVVPQYLQVVGGHDAFGTGLRLMPMMVALALGAGLADRVGRFVSLTTVVVMGFALVALGFAPLIALDVDSGYVPLLAALVGIGAGFGLAVPPAMDAMLGSLPESQESTATSLNTAAKQLAAAIGVAVLGGLVNAAYGRGMDPALAGLDHPLAGAASGSVQGAMEVAGSLGPDRGAALQEAAASAFVHGLNLAAAASTVVCLLLAGVVAVGIGRRPPG
jgi:hypothetical protein